MNLSPYGKYHDKFSHKNIENFDFSTKFNLWHYDLPIWPWVCLVNFLILSIFGKYQKITKLACKERLPAFLNLSKWNSKKLPIKTEIDTNDTIICKVLNKPLAGKFLCRILFFIRKQTLTPAVSPANLGTQTNSNMTKNGARWDLHATQNHHLKTGPSHQNYAHRALTADILGGCAVSPTRNKYQVNIQSVQNAS